MDPHRAWRLLLNALTHDDHEEAIAIATDLLEWLERGGFPPTVVREIAKFSREPLSVNWKLQHELATHACKFVLSMA